MEAGGFPIHRYPSAGLQPKAPLSKLSPSTVFSDIQTASLLLNLGFVGPRIFIHSNE